MGNALVMLPDVMLIFTGMVMPVVSRTWQTTLFASKTPAQITPPDVTVRTEGLDEVYVTVGLVIFVLLEFKTCTQDVFWPLETQLSELLREATSPWTSEKLLLGLIVMEAGVVSGGVEDL